jgi:Protein of unknown function, DUF547
LRAIIIIRALESLLLISLLLIWVSAPFLAAAPGTLDQSAWDALLKQYVNAEARVDYARLKQQGIEKLDTYAGQIAAPWPEGMSQTAQKAALINSYNALTVRWVLQNYPVKSIWQTPHPFKEARHTVNSAKVSLDDIEGRLRNMQDPRIHGALVCAARSCPPLRPEAYTADRVDAQLDDNVRKWLANDELNRFLPERHLAQVSMIFKWYKGDFDASGGSVEKFLAKYAPGRKGAFLLEPGATVKFNEYHWGLNDSSGLGADYSKTDFLWNYLKNKL